MMSIDILEPYFKFFNTVILNASIDNIGDKNTYLRKGSNWDIIEKNIIKYNKICKIEIQPCITMFNINDIPIIENFCKKHSLTLCLNNEIYDPTFLSHNVLPEQLTKVKTKYDKEKFIMAIEYMLELDKKYNDDIREYYPDFYDYYLQIKEN